MMVPALRIAVVRDTPSTPGTGRVRSSRWRNGERTAGRAAAAASPRRSAGNHTERRRRGSNPPGDAQARTRGKGPAPGTANPALPFGVSEIRTRNRLYQAVLGVLCTTRRELPSVAWALQTTTRSGVETVMNSFVVGGSSSRMYDSKRGCHAVRSFGKTTGRRWNPPALAATVVVVFLGTACGGGSQVATVGVAPSSSRPPTSVGITEASTATTSAAPRQTATPQQQGPGPPQAPVTGPLNLPAPARRTDSYLPPGPIDNVTPPETHAAELLTQGKCGVLLQRINVGDPLRDPPKSSWSVEGADPDVISLYTAAAEACLGNWEPAETAFKKISSASDFCRKEVAQSDPDNPGDPVCVERRLQVYNWTAGLIEAHRSDPSFVPNFPHPPT